MIHLAMWVASALFLCFIGFLVLMFIVHAWKEILFFGGGIVLIILALVWAYTPSKKPTRAYDAKDAAIEQVQGSLYRVKDEVQATVKKVDAATRPVVKSARKAKRKVVREARKLASDVGVDDVVWDTRIDLP